MSVKPFVKDPNEVLDYGINWIKLIGSDTILTSSWIVPDGITKVSDTFEKSISIVWISGGNLDTTYTLEGRINTIAGRTFVRHINIKISEK